MPQSANTSTENDVDTHDPAGMARWLRERRDAALEFYKLDGEAQQRQFLQRWQQYVLPHLAFRFGQAATMIETQAAEIERLRAALAIQAISLMTVTAERGRLARYILTNLSGDWRIRDHACAQCVPGGEIVQAGFVCSYHLASAIVNGPAVDVPALTWTCDECGMRGRPADTDTCANCGAKCSAPPRS